MNTIEKTAPKVEDIFKASQLKTENLSGITRALELAHEIIREMERRSLNHRERLSTLGNNKKAYNKHMHNLNA